MVSMAPPSSSSGASNPEIDRSAVIKLSRVGSSMFLNASSRTEAPIQLHRHCGKLGTPSWSVYSAKALRAVQQIFSLVGSRAGRAEHPVSLAKRDIEMISHHVTLNWREAAVRNLAAIA